MNKKYIFGFSILPVLLSGFFLSQALAQGWTDPACPPPGCNTYAPLNVGPDTQGKLGGLDIGQVLLVRGGALLNTANSPGGLGLIIANGGAGILNGGLYVSGGNGDANGDGVININDMAIASECAQGALASSTCGRVDINGDGFVNLLDLDVMQNAFGGTVTISDRRIAKSMANNLISPRFNGSLDLIPSGDLNIKSNSASGSLNIGKNGFVSVNIQGSLNVSPRIAPASYFYVKGSRLYGQEIQWNQPPPASSGWNPEWVLNKMSCDTTPGGEECVNSTYPGAAASRDILYDRHVIGEGTAGIVCPVPPNGNRNCKYYLVAYPFLKTVEPSTSVGGDISGTRGFFSENIILGNSSGNLTVIRGDGIATFAGRLSITPSTTRVTNGLNVSEGGGDVFTVRATSTTIANDLIVNNLCLNGDCKSSWPTGTGNSGGNSGSSDWQRNGNDLVTAGGIQNVGMDVWCNRSLGSCLQARTFSIGGNPQGFTFSTNSGEGIFSERGAGGSNRYGVDIYTWSQKRLSISSSGNVGIGVDPLVGSLQKLYVGGNIRASGNVQATQYCDENGSNCFSPASVNGGGSGSGTPKHYQTYNNSDNGDSLTMNNLRAGKTYAISVYGGKGGPDGNATIPAIILRACNGSSGELVRTNPFNINWPDGWMSLSHTFYIQIPPSGCVFAVLDNMNSGGINTVSVAQLD